MIYFKIRPDKFFLAIVDEALRYGLSEAHFMSQEEDVETWEGVFPSSACRFSPSTAVVALKQLIMAVNDSRVFLIPDSHWLLLYECLKAFCSDHDDLLEDDPEQRILVGSFRMGILNCEAMVSLYYWDTDFLIDPRAENGLSQDACECLEGSWNEYEEKENVSFDLSKFQVVQEVAWREGEPEGYFDYGSGRYPWLDEGHDGEIL